MYIVDIYDGIQRQLTASNREYNSKELRVPTKYQDSQMYLVKLTVFLLVLMYFSISAGVGVIRNMNILFVIILLILILYSFSK